MAAHDCHRLLAWALPKLGLRAEGFERVRRQICKRMDRRRQDLGLGSVAEYWARLESDPEEWPALDQLCRVTISRFYRDAWIWDALRPRLGELATDGRLRCWSAGSASGEEAWTLRLIAGLDPASPDAIEVVGTDVDPHMVGRARAARYPPGTLRELPGEWGATAFQKSAGEQRLRDEWRTDVRFEVQDLREGAPEGLFDLVLCRNLAFTYFGEEALRSALNHLTGALRAGGILAVGKGELVPAGHGLSAIEGAVGLYRRD
ncbi:MAG: chemotaxis protein methyltransferase CheR [Myxococcota bacterium]|jgi:chemotaxis protein methyltransferase CheR